MPTLQSPKTVWSSEDGDLRKQDEKSAIVNSLPPQQQTIYLHRESKGRGGKDVTLVKGLVLSEGDLSTLTKKLKQTCGSGGTVKDGVIEIQGEHRENEGARRDARDCRVSMLCILSNTKIITENHA